MSDYVKHSELALILQVKDELYKKEGQHIERIEAAADRLERIANSTRMRITKVDGKATLALKLAQENKTEIEKRISLPRLTLFCGAVLAAAAVIAYLPVIAKLIRSI